MTNTANSANTANPANPTFTCPHYDKCDAPLCPLFESMLIMAGGNWYANEPVCRSRKYPRYWLDMQRKVTRLKPTPPGYWTIADLDRLRRVRPGITGRLPEEEGTC